MRVRPRFGLGACFPDGSHPLAKASRANPENSVMFDGENI